MAMNDTTARQHHCPRCGVARVDRDEAASALEAWFLERLGRRAYRCRACERRFYDRPTSSSSEGPWVSESRRPPRRPLRWAWQFLTTRPIVWLVAAAVNVIALGVRTRVSVAVDLLLATAFVAVASVLVWIYDAFAYGPDGLVFVQDEIDLRKMVAVLLAVAIASAFARAALAVLIHLTP
jgi:hypothetical protein